MFKTGDAVRVTSQTDDTLDEKWLGRIGFVKDVTSYQRVGDAPPEDPFVEVSHGPAFGDRAQHNCYWPEELEKTMDEQAKRGATMKVALYQEAKPNDNSETLPLGRYEVCEIKWLSYRDLGGNHFRGAATFVVASGEHASSKRRIGCIDNGILAKT